MNKSLISVLRDRKADILRMLLACVFIGLVFIPLFKMFTYVNADSIRKVIKTPIFLEAVTNSLVSTAISTAITLVLAYTLAMCVERTNIKYKSFFGILFVLPMLIPSISNGMGLILLFGNNGLVTNLLHLNGNIYGLSGIVVGSVLYAFPVAFLMLSDIMRYEDSSPYEAAKVLGMNKFRQFTAITFPYLRKPLISVVFSVFTLIITDYGVPLMVGGKYTTIPVVMYQEVIGQLDFAKGAVYGCLLLIPAVAAFIIDLANKDKGNSTFVAKPITPENGWIRKLFSYILCVLTSLFVLLPIISFVLLAFTKKYPINLTITVDNIRKALQLNADKYLLNSLIMSLLVAGVGTAISFMTAYMTARMHSKTSKFLHLSSITSAAIPGMVLGLSYVLTFKSSPLFGTLAILVMANIIHFIASPYLMVYNSLSKLNSNLEGVGHTLDISRGKMIRDVFIPQCKNTLMEMFSYFFVNCMMTISAVSFLSTTANKPVSLMINQFEAQMQLECAAVISLAILGVNLIVKGTFRLLNTNKRKKQTT